MKVTKVSSTELKRETAEIINKVVYGDTEVVIERYGEPVARIAKERVGKKKTTDLKKAIKRTFGSMPDFPDVTKYRYSRKRDISW